MAQELTKLLSDVGNGDEAARLQLLALVYGELRDLAAGQMRRERADHTLQPTALVNEAYMRLFGGRDVRWENRAHFFGAAAEVMRRILIDHARARLAAKRGRNETRVALVEDIGEAVPAQPENLLAVDEALTALEVVDADKARLVMLRFYGGLTVEQIAEALGSSERTVKREWRYAKAWLYRRLTENS